MSSPSKWKSAVDPRTGRVYFYDPVTRETRWERPSESAAAEAEERRQFFDAMERNIRSKLSAGFSSVVDEAEAKADDIVGVATERDPAFDFPSLTPGNGDEGRGSEDPPLRTRTLSSMDDMVLPSAKETKDAERRRESMLGLEPASPAGAGGAPAGASASASASREEGEAPAAEREAKDVFDVSSDVRGRRLSNPELVQVGNRPRANTTNSMHVSTTMSVPDREATIQVVCSVLRAHMLECLANRGVSAPRFAVFNDLSSTTASVPEGVALSGEAQAAPVDDSVVPELSTIVAFMRDVFFKSQMEAECLIMSLAYVERLLKTTRGELQLRPSNWRPIVLSTLIMASKVWDDLSMWNVDFSVVCPSFTLQRINELELGILEALHYNVRVSSSVYAKYYFHLRSWSCKLNMRGAVDHSPLDLEGARRLESLSADYQERSTTVKRRCNTMAEDGSDASSPSSSLSGLRSAASSLALEQVVS